MNRYGLHKTITICKLVFDRMHKYFFNLMAWIEKGKKDNNFCKS